MEVLALILFYISLIGILISIGLIIYRAIKKELKYEKKKLLLKLVTFIILFIGSIIFYGTVQSPESKAKYEASQKSKTEEAEKELVEKEKKTEEEGKQQQDAQEEKNKQEAKIESEIKENKKLVIASEPNTTAAVDEIINKGNEDSSKASEEDIKRAIKFINDNYNNYWTDNETMHKGMYYGSLLEYAKRDKAKENQKGLDYTIYSLGVDTVQVIKYVYRGAETKEDEATQSNLRQIEKSLNSISNDYK